VQLARSDAAVRDIVLHVGRARRKASSIYHCDAVAITQALVRKALSDQQMSDLRAGLGMSLALAAEPTAIPVHTSALS
jgi:hypothetical protein